MTTRSDTSHRLQPICIAAGVLAALAWTACAGDVLWEGRVWQSLNPGGGGNIQSLTLDPVTPGRIYWCSDMEGLYRSDDRGETWCYLGADLSESYVNVVAVDPRDPARVYAGTQSGLEISDDGGRHWRRAPQIADSVGGVETDPLDSKSVFALPGKRHRWSAGNGAGMPDDATRGPLGERDFYRSDDRGASWRRVNYASGIARRDILSWDRNPRDPSHVAMAALPGLLESTDNGASWRSVPAPAGAGDCLGATFGHDGQRLYACYRVSSPGAAVAVTTGMQGVAPIGESHLFGLSLAARVWQDLSAGMPGFTTSARGHTLYWRPRRTLRECAGVDSLLVGTCRPQHGLWRVSVDADTGSVTSASWQRVLGYDINSQVSLRHSAGFDFGWERWGIAAEDYHTAPLVWGRHAVYATGGQTAFRTVGGAWAWEPIYCRFAGQVDGVSTYRTRGVDSMFCFDADAFDRYAVQSVADNCLLESFDGGYAWTSEGKPGPWTSSRSDAVLITRGLSAPIVLAHASVGWGANAQPGALYAKRLSPTPSPRNRWWLIAGGPDRRGGVPAGVYNRIVQDPHDPRRIYIGCAFEDIYVVDDIGEFVRAAEQGRAPRPARSVTQQAAEPRPRDVRYQGTGMAVDPLDPNVLYVGSNRHLWRGARQEDGAWRWTRIRETRGEADFGISVADGRTVLALAREDGSGGLDVSADAGATWQPRVTRQSLLATRLPPAWYRGESRLQASGLIGDGDAFYFTVVTGPADGRRALGAYRCAALLQGAADVQDLTADLPWPYAVRCRVLTVQGVRYLYVCTRGNGLWRRPLP